MTFSVKNAKRILKNWLQQGLPIMNAQSVDISPNEHGPRQPHSSRSLFPNILEVPDVPQEAVKKLTDPQQKSCLDQLDAPPQNQKQSSLPNEEWACIDCGEKERLYIIISKDREETNNLLDDDIVACENCGFRMFGSTMNSWFFNRNKERKRRSRKTKE